jgi:hypothetical protein
LPAPLKPPGPPVAPRHATGKVRHRVPAAARIRTFQRQVAHFRTVAPQIDKLLSVEYRVRRLLVVIAQPRIASPIVRPQIVMQ